MAIKLITKQEPSEDALLVSLGLTTPTPVKAALSIGVKVQVNHDLFPWVKSYSKGDVGTVIGMSLCKDAGGTEDRGDYDVLKVLLDTPRTEEVVHLSRWEVSLVV